MSIINLMEDVVKNATDLVIKDEPEFKKVIPYKNDIIAYVLNRIPPKYTTSERGILHVKLDAKYEIQQKTDILMLIHEAIKVIQTGRASELHGNDDAVITNNCFPHIIGEVLEETTFSIIPGIEVALLFNNIPVQMVDDNWKNPYLTNSATMGHFHFWPKYIEETMGSASKVPFTIIFRHPKFIEKSITIEVETLTVANIGQSFVTPITLLELKEGVDLNSVFIE